MAQISKPIEAATPFSAILLIFAAGALFSCLDAAAKLLVLAGMEPLFVAWFRFAEHSLLALVFLQVWRNRQILRTGNPLGQIVRGLILFGTTLFNFLALQTLQLAETVSIFFFGPMVITALAGPLLGEWAGWRRWMAILVGFTGVLVITRPGYGAFEIGHLFALGAMLCYCVYVIMTRRMGARESAESLIFYSALVPALAMLPVIPFYATLPPDGLSWMLFLALGLVGGFGHWMLIKAYQRASTAALAPYPYLQIVWMVAFGYLVFDQLPDGWTVAGAAIIIASGLYVVHREHRLRLLEKVAPELETRG